MKQATYIFILLSVLGMGLRAQGKKVASWEVKGIVGVGVDRPGDFYLLTQGGGVVRVGKDGKKPEVFQPMPRPTLFDPRDGARLFVYNREGQVCLFVNPRFENPQTIPIDPAYAISPYLVCPSGDTHLWVLDSADVSLKRINIRTGGVEVDRKISHSESVVFSKIAWMREYQNMLFLSDGRSGALVFNPLGRQINRLDIGNNPSVNFLGEELYFLSGKSTLKFYNLFSGETREQALPVSCDFALVTDERLMVVRGSTVDIYPYRP